MKDTEQTRDILKAREEYVQFLCDKQGVTLEELYRLVPSVAARAKVYSESSKWHKRESE